VVTLHLRGSMFSESLPINELHDTVVLLLALDLVYGTVAWQYVDQIHNNTMDTIYKDSNES
jgi:hypothetical protein